MQPANFLFYRFFTKENEIYFLRKSSSPFSLQELRPLIPLKEKDRFTSLTVIGMMKIMCNKGVTVDLDGVRTKEYFEVIEIVDGTTPYPSLLGLDWVFDNQEIINLKTRNMTFESK
jgi:hypothetical protein